MHVLKMVTTLTNPQDPEWDMLVKKTLGEKIHPDRVKGFLLSREALKNALIDLKNDLPISALQMEKHHQISGLPQFTISLSHTADCGVALVGERKIFRSLGIDIEREARPVKDFIIERISNPEDEKLRSIELWCLKEAAFKAIMNTEMFPDPIEFSSIKITRDYWIHSPSGLEGECKVEVVNGFILATAFLKN